MRYYQREPWNVGFELSPCSAPGRCKLMRKQSKMHDTCARTCGERCVRSESLVPWRRESGGSRQR
eukprot:4535274-Prymnesium_polylepis.1